MEIQGKLVNDVLVLKGGFTIAALAISDRILQVQLRGMQLCETALKVSE